MPFRIRYTFNIDYIGPGAGPMQGLNPTGGMLPGGGGTGQTADFVNNVSAPNLITNTFLTADVTTLTNGAAADMAAQLNAAATLARIQAFSSGNP